MTTTSPDAGTVLAQSHGAVTVLTLSYAARRNALSMASRNRSCRAGKRNCRAAVCYSGLLHMPVRSPLSRARIAFMTLMSDTSILFCGDPHGRFAHILRVAQQFPSTPVVLLGDMEPQNDLLIELRPIASRLWWIHGNHDTDQEAVAHRVWDDKVVQHSINARVVILPWGAAHCWLGRGLPRIGMAPRSRRGAQRAPRIH